MPRSPRSAHTNYMPPLSAGLFLLLLAPQGARVAVNPPEPPRASLELRTAVSSGDTVRIPRGGNVQRAIDRARPGTVLVLEAGATYRGPVVLRGKGASGWITIRTSAPDSLLPLGQRVSPRSRQHLARLVSSEPGASVVTTERGASRYRLIGLEITADSALRQLTSLVAFGGDPEVQRTLDGIASHLVLDRSWVHGHGALTLQRCLVMNSGAAAVVDSYLSECHAKGFDSQAILGYNGPGPYRILNNYLEGAGENIMFGGADPGIPNLIPSDIEIRGNHVTKPLNWKGRWTVKNLFELKSARRVLVEGNVFENNWSDAQTGFAVVLKSTNQDGRAPWSQTSDVIFRHNIVRNTTGFLNLASNPESYPAVPASRILLEHNLCYDVGRANGTDGGRMLQMLGGLTDVSIRHNTFLHNAEVGQFLVFDAPNGGQRLDISGNIATKGGEYGPMSAHPQQGSEGLAAFMSPWVFRGNVIIGVAPVVRSWYPPGNAWPATLRDVGFTDPSRGIFSLSRRSGYLTSGPISAIPGANFTRVQDATRHVIAGLADSAQLRLR